MENSIIPSDQDLALRKMETDTVRMIAFKFHRRGEN
jgi:hypothetical protein